MDEGVIVRRSIIVFLVIVLGLVVILLSRRARETPEQRTVVVYVSEDQVFSEPILRDFERESGIKVKAVYDTEEAKCTGSMNRLIAEKDNPQADVYSANEPIRAEVLKQKGIAEAYRSGNAQGIPPVFKDPEGYWTGFSARARVLIVRRGIADPPTSILAFNDPRWKGKAVISNPLFGTTTSHVAALFVAWGDERARRFMEDMKENEVGISTSNGESADFVASGRYAFSLVDSDDAVNRMRQGEAVDMIHPDQQEGGSGCFIVPNAVVLIHGAPHPETARQLIDHLLSEETERKLALADCAQIPLHPGVPAPPELKAIADLKVLRVDYAEVARKMVEIQAYLKEWVGL